MNFIIRPWRTASAVALFLLFVGAVAIGSNPAHAQDSGSDVATTQDQNAPAAQTVPQSSEATNPVSDVAEPSSASQADATSVGEAETSPPTVSTSSTDDTPATDTATDTSTGDTQTSAETDVTPATNAEDNGSVREPVPDKPEATALSQDGDATPPATAPEPESESGSTATAAAPPNTAPEPATKTEPDAQATATKTSEPAADADPQPVPERVPEPPSSIRIATWSGAYGEAQRKAIFEPFAKDAGIEVRTVAHKGGAKLLEPTAQDSLAWDLADVPYHVADAACRAGAIANLDPVDIAESSGGPLDRGDFIPNAITPCAIGGTVWSSVIAYDRAQFRRNIPSRLEDFFDVSSFAGKRGLPNHPRYVLEMALLADGVAPDQIYDTLASAEGVTRALAKLDTIREQIVWMTTVRQPVELLRNGTVTMAVGFSGRFFIETAGRDDGIALLWDGQIYDMDVWVVPKGTTHMPTALKFLTHAVKPEVMARQASLLPYGPTRRSAAQQVAQHASLDIDMRAYLPTAPQNFARALRLDAAWWQDNEPRLNEQFRNWIENKQTSEPEDSEVSEGE